MSTFVLIPWRHDEGRMPGLQYVMHQWRRWFPDWETHLGNLAADADWCKADAVELALRGAAPADEDMIVVADADVWVDPEMIRLAVDSVRRGETAWAMPHRLVHRLSAEATAATLDGVDLDSAVAVHGYDRQPYVGTVGGGMTALTAGSYRECPLDPRFVGWGQEDESWGEALRTVLGRRFRGMGDLWHLWHPPMARAATGVGNQHGVYVRDQYRRCNGDPARMRRLIDSGREFLISD